ncbi:unnamed protein product, partial [Dovyalis caffra]
VNKTSRIDSAPTCIEKINEIYTKKNERQHPPAPFFLPSPAIETCRVMNYRILSSTSQRVGNGTETLRIVKTLQTRAFFQISMGFQW